MVYFIGAGPGDAELITLKARDIISKADLIIYAGTSVPGWLLHLAKPSCIMMDSTSISFREQIEAMVMHKDRTVCRVHQGSLGIFSTVKEYLDVLDSQDIPYECIGGVSVVEYICSKLHLETCLQGVSQGLIICRSDSVDNYLPKRKNQDVRSFAVHQTSMIIFMVEQEVGHTAVQLVKGGFRGDTPCILFGNASCPDEWYRKFSLRELQKPMKFPQGMFVMLVGDFISAVNQDVVNYSDKELILPRILD